MQSKTAVETRVMTLMLTATYGESVSSMPFLDNGPPIGPIENGTRYIVLPFIHLGNLSSIASSRASGLIQWPSVPLTPSAGSGMVSNFSGVEMTVLDSTLATSLGSVLAKKQLSYFGKGVRIPFLTS